MPFEEAQRIVEEGEAQDERRIRPVKKGDEVSDRAEVGKEQEASHNNQTEHQPYANS